MSITKTITIQNNNQSSLKVFKFEYCTINHTKPKDFVLIANSNFVLNIFFDE